MNGGAVYHLQPACDDAGGNDRRHAIAALLALVKGHEHRARGLRFPEDADGDFGDHPQEALGTGHQAECIVGGEAVFQAMHAAYIFGDIAADL